MRHAAHACTGGFTSPKANSYAGSWPFGCMYHSRVKSTSCCLAKSGSSRANGIMWNARSQAAYHGYSHLSQHRDDVAMVEMPPLGVAAAAPPRRRRLAAPGRPRARRARRSGRTASCRAARVRLAHQRALRIRASVGGNAVGIEGVRLADAAARDVARTRRRTARRAASRLGRAGAGARTRSSPAGIVESIAGRRLGAARLADCTASAPAADHVVVKRVLHVRAGVGGAEQPLRLVSLSVKSSSGRLARWRRSNALRRLR